jgi:3-hydroxyisobutyrate dehydrogenase
MRVGFIGIGNMGAPMSANLARAGHDVVLYDSSHDAVAKAAVESGARAVASLADIARCEAIVTMLPTGAIVRSVILEAEGGVIAATAAPGTVIVDMSSSEPVGTRELAATLAPMGLALVDAPVSGGVARAVTGKLAIMIGADDKTAIERVRPLLLAMGERLFETGGSGSGHAMKALNNFVAASAFAATAEAMIIGKRFGLDPGLMVDVLNVSTGRNFHTDVVMKEHVVGGKYASGFAVGLLAKDVAIAAGLGKAMGADAPLSRVVADRWAEARNALGPHRDNTAAILAWDRDLA